MAKQRNLYLGDTPLNTHLSGVKDEIVVLDGIRFNKIANYDAMPPFFMTLTGSGDHWMFISSNGALTAGRRDPKNALFPYTTDDKITDSAEYTGSKTILQVESGDKVYLWEPFSYRYAGAYDTQRNIYKSIYGDILKFEEVNRSLGLSFSYSWQYSRSYGIVKTSELHSISGEEKGLTLLDGIQNILPYGVDEGMQLQYSTLVDAYKKNELDISSGIGIYYLSSIPTDKAEPSEGLKATTVWSAGLENPLILLSSTQLEAFRLGQTILQESDVRARRGAYFIHGKILLPAAGSRTWWTVAELEQDRRAINGLRKALKQKESLMASLKADLKQGTRDLIDLVSRADGLQLSADDKTEARHFSNVLYNCMRGGIFPEQYRIDREDFIRYLQGFNTQVASRFVHKINSVLAETVQREDLLAFAGEQEDQDLWRLTEEYLPLTFSRRHGDPSRPWNRFHINNQNSDGSPRLDYQGNWRDIFQNWEALAYSYPGYISGMICRFLNASTADGYNPYRIMKSGIDWEVIDPEDPWSNIGYWGDHQIIYLLKLMELSERFYPGQLGQWLNRESFVYTHLPYRIRNYPERLADPRNTIDYDEGVAETIASRIQELGADGKLVREADSVYRINLTEKLLVPVLAKLSNLVVDGGIWLNTQRPEWNDANNALVGNGLSIVTVYYLRRHIVFIKKLIQDAAEDSFSLSGGVLRWIKETHAALQKFHPLLNDGFRPASRRALLDALGFSLDAYLKEIYQNIIPSKKEKLDKVILLEFLSEVLEYIDRSIANNQREDKLFHAYNLMKVEPDGGISIGHLQEMLEGQVAVLSSGYLSPENSLEVLHSLRSSAMYREDQQSYTLYPNTDLPHFLEKNRLDASVIKEFELAGAMLKADDHRLLSPDGEGGYQFNGSLKNRADLEALYETFKKDYSPGMLEKEKAALIELFETSFGHHSFTGRSGTFFKYEGLGSIYWHMVSKLVLTIGEVYQRARAENGDPALCDQLAEIYHVTKEGLGLHKSPAQYGAFTTDPYSHTPGHTGVQQPGMTGQVKEDIISRWMELGLVIAKGILRFEPALLSAGEFITESRMWSYINVRGERCSLDIPKDALAFTFCQVPVIYHLSSSLSIRILLQDGTFHEEGPHALDAKWSGELFRRTGKIERIDVFIDKAVLAPGP